MTTATGFIALPAMALRTMLSQSATFRSWTSAPSEAAALEHAYIFTAVDPGPVFALINFADLTRERAGVTNAREFVHDMGGCALSLYFYQEIGQEENEPEAGLFFASYLAAVMVDLEMAAGNVATGTLSIRSHKLLSAPTRITAEERDAAGDYYEAAFSLNYTRKP
jgi:hypothetical protein